MVWSLSQTVSTTHLPTLYNQLSELKYTYSPSIPSHNYLQSIPNGFLKSSRGDRPRLLLERIRRNSLLPLPMVPRTFHCSVRNPRRRWTDFCNMRAIHDVSKGNAIRRPRNSRGNHAGQDPKGAESLRENSLRLHGYGLVCKQGADCCGRELVQVHQSGR